MGVVYAAYDPELDRKVAIKLLHAVERERRDEARARLLRESQALARLSHPNVITVHDVGVLGDGVFMVMEFVDGLTVKHWLQQQPRPWRRVLDVFLDAGRGLAAAHAAGIVHRDFKPSNIMLGSDGTVQVVDFGLAHPAGDASEDGGEAATPHLEARTGRDSIPMTGMLTTPLTEAGTVMGTPGYMAPEQYRGEATDARTDLFGFCVALYEGVHGERPFTGKDRKELERRVLAGEIREPAGRVAVPAWLHRVLLRGLSVDPQGRFESMDELLAALERHPRRIRRLWLGAAAVAIALTAGASGFALLGERGPTVCQGAERKLVGVWDADRKSAVREAFLATGRSFAQDTWERVEPVMDDWAQGWVTMHTEACEATHVYGEQSQQLLDLRMQCLGRRLGELDALGGLFAVADPEVLEHAVQAASALAPLDGCGNAEALSSVVRPPDDPEVAARVDALQADLARATALGSAGKYADGREVARAAVDAAAELGYTPLLAEALLELGMLLDYAADLEDAEATLHRAVQAAERARDDEVKARAWIQLVFVVGYRQARHEEGLRLADLADAVIDRAGSEDLLRARLSSFRGSVLLTQGRRDEALAHQQRALEVCERELGPDHPQVAQALEKLGAALEEQGRYDDALIRYERALAIWERALGPDHPRLAVSLNNISVVHSDQERWEDALAYSRRALRLLERALGSDHRRVAELLINLANALHGLERLDEAREHLERVLQILEKAYGTGHPNVATVLNNLGNLLRDQGHPKEALEHLERALNIWQQALPADHPILAYPLTNMGVVYLDDLGDPGRAITSFERALALREAGTVAPAERAATRFALARALWLARTDRKRALELATVARQEYVAAGEPGRAYVTKIDAWLAARVRP
jgi:tetratricopeptide (TPR) repeat protein